MVKKRVRPETCPAAVSLHFNNNIAFPREKTGLRKKATNLAARDRVNHETRTLKTPLINYTGSTLTASNRNKNIQNYEQLHNYSHVAGGAHNTFDFQLEERIKNVHSSTGIPHQHKNTNRTDICNSCTPFSISNLNYQTKENSEKILNEIVDELNYKELSTGKCVLDVDKKSTDEQSTDDLTINESVSKRHKILKRTREKCILKLPDLNVNLCQDERSKVCRLSATEKFVEKAGVVKKKEAMNNSDISDVLSLNEELQTMWREKEGEVREILERFSTYRIAVEADSKEKEEIFADEILKRESTIQDLKCLNKKLEEQLVDKEAMIDQLKNDLEHKENMYSAKMSEVNEIMKELESSGDKIVQNECEKICEKFFQNSKHDEMLVDSVNDLGKSNKCGGYDENMKDRQVSGDECSHEYSDDDSVFLNNEDSERNEEQNSMLFDYSRNTSTNDISTVFTNNDSEVLHEGRKSESVDDEVLNILKQLENIKNDDAMNGEEDYIEKKVVVRLFEEQLIRYQMVCKEKDDELEHVVKKQKQDLKNLQDLLEEQERNELQNNETLTKLQEDVDKLNKRNKFLENEVEIVKEEEENEMKNLQEQFEINLKEQLKQQSLSLTSNERACRRQLVEMEQKNEELRSINEDLHRQITEHCTEIKSWVSEILLLSEEEYNDEFHSITDVLAKLSNIIMNNKQKIEELEEELEAKGENMEDSLSQSWAGFSWKEAQSETVCNNCRQKKLRRILKGSFDLGEMAIDVQQEDLNGFIKNIDVTERRYKKRQSLWDSLEMAEAQSKLKETLGDEQWDSLERLGEKSLERGTSSLDELPSLSETGDSSSREIMTTGSWEEGTHELPLIVVSDSGEQLGVTGEDDELKRANDDKLSDEQENKLDDKINVEEEEGRKEVDDCLLNGFEGKKENHRMKCDGEVGPLQDEDEDVVHVVNLYRTLVSNPCLTVNDHYDKVINNNNDDMINNNYVRITRVQSSPSLSINHPINQDRMINNDNIGIDKENKVNFVNNYSPCLSFTDDNYHIDNQVIDDCTNNQENIKQDTTLQEDVKDVVNNITPYTAVSDQPLVYVDEEKGALFQRSIERKIEDNLEKCPRCSDILSKNSILYEKILEKLLEMKEVQENEKMTVWQELKEVKREANEYRDKYLSLTEVCENYERKLKEHRENLCSRNEELRKLKITSSVMKTEVVWLRQALDITTADNADYYM